MTRHRVLIDIEFTVDDNEFKVAHFDADSSGVSDVTESGVRDAVTDGIVATDWAGRGLLPVRSVVTSRELGSTGEYAGIAIPSDAGVAPD